ncbi:PREDICTED: deleted in esophageal cancer 1, partial [Galeopterus variegatus]|uniref:Deleted in esophageal cancer 1 n=1 Tax=Galeopterus variegatus TaxID=482537 RepID=A0ABM0S2N0_GALVR
MVGLIEKVNLSLKEAQGGRSVKWQAGLCHNGENDFSICLVRSKTAEGL